MSVNVRNFSAKKQKSKKTGVQMYYDTEPY